MDFHHNPSRLTPCTSLATTKLSTPTTFTTSYHGLYHRASSHLLTLSRGVPPFEPSCSTGPLATHGTYTADSNVRSLAYFVQDDRGVTRLSKVDPMAFLTQPRDPKTFLLLSGVNHNLFGTRDPKQYVLCCSLLLGTRSNGGRRRANM